MHDARAMSAIERVRDRDSDFEGFVERQRPALETLGERLALQVLHDQVVDLAALVRLGADVVQRADVGMRERRDGLRLAVEALLHLGIQREVRRQHLDGDRAVQPRVGGLVDLPHAARADGREDFIRT